MQQQLGAPRSHQAADAEHFTGTGLEVDAAQCHAALPGWIHLHAAQGQQRASRRGLTTRIVVFDAPPHHAANDLVGIGTRGFERALGRTVAQDGDAICDREYFIQFVRDEHAGHAARAQPPQLRQQRIDLVARKCRRGLVQHQHLRLARDGAGNLDELLLADAEIADTRRRIELDATIRQRRGGLRVDAVPVDAPEPVRKRSQEQVLADRHVRKQRQLLVDDRDAGPLRVAGRAKFDGPIVDDDVTLVAAVRMHTRQQLDQRGLARTVLAAQCVNLAGTQLEADAVERNYGAEALADRTGRQDGAIVHGRGGRWASGTPR